MGEIRKVWPPTHEERVERARAAQSAEMRDARVHSDAEAEPRHAVVVELLKRAGWREGPGGAPELSACLVAMVAGAGTVEHVVEYLGAARPGRQARGELSDAELLALARAIVETLGAPI